MTRPRLHSLRGFVLPVLILVALEVMVRTIGIESEALAAPSQIVVALFEKLGDGTILAATWQTLSAAAGGLAVGAAIGLALGIAFGVFPIVFWLCEFTTEVIRPIPSLALLPIALLVFGFGYTMEITLVAKAAIWPMMFMTHAAIAGINQRILEVSRLLQLSWGEILRKIVLPAIVPAFFVGFRLAVGVAILVALSIEITANPRGLGYALMRAEQAQNPAVMLAVLLWVAGLGWAINAVLVSMQKTLFFRFSVPTEAG